MTQRIAFTDAPQNLDRLSPAISEIDIFPVAAITLASHFLSACNLLAALAVFGDAGTVDFALCLALASALRFGVLIQSGYRLTTIRKRHERMYAPVYAYGRMRHACTLWLNFNRVAQRQIHTRSLARNAYLRRLYDLALFVQWQLALRLETQRGESLDANPALARLRIVRQVILRAAVRRDCAKTVLALEARKARSSSARDALEEAVVSMVGALYDAYARPTRQQRIAIARLGQDAP